MTAAGGSAATRDGVVRAAALVAVVVTAVSALGLLARATYGARTTADEPQYLLTAISLAEDGDLDIADELAAQRYRPFHEVRLPVQTERLDGGRQVSPHDPLLPMLLAGPVALGGWVGAKLALAALAGALAGVLVWTAVRRLAVPLGIAVVVVSAFALAPPFAVYGTQVYPEVPAALAVAVAVAAVTGPLGRGGLTVFALAVVALPWLGAKYAPVAAALAAIVVVRLVRRPDRRAVVALVGGLALAAVAWLVAHRLLYGGWTSYATGDHFTGGETTVIGVAPDYVGRSRRLVGLLLDRQFGLAAWHPGWLLVVPAVAALLRRRPRGGAALIAPLAAGWLTATFVALTMHGWWWPGRQVVVVLPLVVLAIAWWVGQVPAARPWAVAGGVAGLVAFGFLVVEGAARRLTWVVDFADTANPLYRAARAVLPDYADPTPATWLLQGAWLVVLALLALAGWRSVGATSAPTTVSSQPIDAVVPRATASLTTTGGSRP